MAGVVVQFEGKLSAHRILRDDVLDAMFGKTSSKPKNLIDSALSIALKHTEISGIGSISDPILGLYPGEVRSMDADSLNDAIRMAALMFSSLANLDHIDEIEAEDAPTQDETNRRLATEVREIVTTRRPDLSQYFNRNAQIVDDGDGVRIGFLSTRTALHYGVLHPARQPSSVKDARARIFELSRVAAFVGLNDASLIIGVPRTDDPTLGTRQRENIMRNTLELKREAASVDVNLRPVHSAEEAAQQTEALA